MTIRSRHLATTVALVAIAGFAVFLQTRPAGPGARLETTAGADVRPLPPPAPRTARELLDRRVALSVTAAQARRLEALDRQWVEESRSLQAAVGAAREEFGRFMESQTSRGTSLADLLRRSADYRALSAELRERRRRHGEAAGGLLADWQRERLERRADRADPRGNR